MVAKRQSEDKETKASDSRGKPMICVFFSLRRFFAVSAIGNGDLLNSECMIKVVFSEIGTNATESRPQNGRKNPILHIESAPCENSGQTSVEIENLGLSRISEPPYSPDISPCDSWLFGFLKKQFPRTQSIKLYLVDRK
jgi:hypothetical protein